MNSRRKNYTIVGAGFGLYGYLPAVVSEHDARVLLPSRYREKMESRPDLSPYVDGVSWRASIAEALSESRFVVIAVPPHQQARVVEQVLGYPNVEAIILEKPVSPTPKESINLLDSILSLNRRVRVAYTFLQTPWYKKLKLFINEKASALRINWKFSAKHFLLEQDTWKRYHSLGGGVVRFYGIHLLAALAGLGYQNATTTFVDFHAGNQPARWGANFEGLNLPNCEVYVSSFSPKEKFSVEMTGPTGLTSEVFSSDSPFGHQSSSADPDFRVPVLNRLVRSLDDNDCELMSLYRSTNTLWMEAETTYNRFR